MKTTWIPIFEGPTEKSRWIRDSLIAWGIKARYFHSPYQGHHGVETKGSTRLEVKTALSRIGAGAYARLLTRSSYGSSF